MDKFQLTNGGWTISGGGLHKVIEDLATKYHIQLDPLQLKQLCELRFAESFVVEFGMVITRIA
jgi:hypothetical protein